MKNIEEYFAEPQWETGERFSIAFTESMYDTPLPPPPVVQKTSSGSRTLHDSKLFTNC